MTEGARTPPARSTYRHGDLYRALLAEGTALARAAGPDAVVLREATRRAGVVPNAAYRHFTDRDALLGAVAAAAMSELANAMEADLAAIPSDLDPAAAARARLRAVGSGYLRYAEAEPGLFRTAFATPEDERWPRTGGRGLNPFELLAEALDGMVEVGVLPAARRAGAEYAAWSAVHGLAMLLIEGPLRGLGPDERRSAHDRLLDMVGKGL